MGLDLSDQEIKAVGNITIDSVTGTGNSSWAIYQTDSRFIQSTAGNISINSSAATGHGIYIVGGGLVAGNSTTTPTAGGSITINSTSRYNAIDGAALRLDGSSTKIIAYGDITIYANGAAAGLSTVNQQGHGIILWGGAQVIRSFAGNLSMTGYATRSVGGDCTNWACISGGITLYSGGVTLQAYNNLTMNGVSGQGIGLYLTFANSTGGGIVAERGNIVMNGLSNAASYGGSIIRLPITATLGSVSISAAGQNYAYYQDAWSGSVSAKTDVNIIGYATAGHGIYLGIGSISSSNGNVIFSGYTSSATTTDYGIYSNAINASASNGSVTFQGSKIDTATSLANALANTSSGSPAPYFAIADSANPAFGATKGLNWSGTVTANTTSGYISINAKAPSITGALTSYGLALISNNQSYTLDSTSNSFSAIAANIGTGTLTLTNSSALTIGSYNGTDGVTAAKLVLSAGGLQGSKNITVTDNTSTISITNASGSYDYSGVIAGPVAVSKSGAGLQKFSGANTYTGATSVTGGTLQSGANTTAGPPPTSGPFGTGTITIGTTGTLDLNGTTLSNALSVSGTGLSAAGVIINSSTTAGGVTGTITMTAASSIGGANPYTLSGVISGAFALTKLGDNTLTLSASNTYTGLTTISAGTLKLGAAGGSINTPLGTTGAGTSITSGATLDLNGYTLGTAETLTINGYGVGSNGALINSGSAASYSGAITVSSASYIGGTGSGFVYTVGGVDNIPGTSWLGDNYDPVLLYGALREAVLYMKGEQDMVTYYEKMYAEAIGQLKRLGDGLERNDAYRRGQTSLPYNQL